MAVDELCDWCEEVLQPFLDRELTDAEMRQAEGHLDECEYCRKRYQLRAEPAGVYVRQARRADAARAEAAPLRPAARALEPRRADDDDQALRVPAAW